MKNDMMQDDATKQQSKYFKWASLTIFITATIVLLLWTIEAPVIFWWIAGILGAAIDVYLWLQFWKLTTGFSNRHEDGGSSVK